MKPYKPYTADEMVALWEEICLDHGHPLNTTARIFYTFREIIAGNCARRKEAMAWVGRFLVLTQQPPKELLEAEVRWIEAEAKRIEVYGGGDDLGVVVKAMRNLRKEYKVQPGEEKAADED